MPIAEKMTPEEALIELEALEGSESMVDAHYDADDILLSVMRYHGHDDIVEAFNNIDKWYA